MKDTSVSPTTASTRRKWIVLALVVAVQFMVVLDVAIVNVALPSIKTDLHFSQVSLQWVITAYSIVFGGVLMLGGRLSDVFGRRRMFIIGLGLFTAFSLMDGLAWSEGSLIAFRLLQGLGAALLSPAALSILMTTFAEGPERNRALGIWAAAAGSGGAAGVLLGGALTSALSWSWIFFINVPVGVAVIALAPFLLRESRANVGPRHFDIAGTTSITAGLMLLVYAMTRAAQHGWGNATSLVLLGTSVGLLVAFFVIEGRSKAPLLPLRMLRLRTLSASNMSALLINAAISAEFLLLTLYMQEVLHYSALQTGVAYISLTLTVILFSGLAQALVTRLGIRLVISTGFALLTVALVMFARIPVHGHYFSDLFAPFLISGLGLALAFVPMSIGSLTGVRPVDAGVASGLINTSQQVGSAVGIAVATSVAATFTASYIHAHVGASALSGAALTHGFQVAFYVLVGVGAVGTVLAGLMFEPHPRSRRRNPSIDAAPALEAGA